MTTIVKRETLKMLRRMTVEMNFINYLMRLVQIRFIYKEMLLPESTKKAVLN